MKHSDKMNPDPEKHLKEPSDLYMTLTELRERIQTLEDGTILTVIFRDKEA